MQLMWFITYKCDSMFLQCNDSGFLRDLCWSYLILYYLRVASWQAGLGSLELLHYHTDTAVRGKGVSVTANTRDTGDRKIVSDTKPWLTPGDIWSCITGKNGPDGREDSIKETSRTR